MAPEYPWYTPYQFAGNTPIQATDLDGLEPNRRIGTGGAETGTVLDPRASYQENLETLHRVANRQKKTGTPSKPSAVGANQATTLVVPIGIGLGAGLTLGAAPSVPMLAAVLFLIPSNSLQNVQDQIKGPYAGPVDESKPQEDPKPSPYIFRHDEKDEEGFTSVYKAPSNTTLAAEFYAIGFHPNRFPRGNGFDGNAYFALERVGAEEYNDRYQAGIITVTFRSNDFDIYFRHYVYPIPGRENQHEVVIPRENLELFNMKTMKRRWSDLPYGK